MASNNDYKTMIKCTADTLQQLLFCGQYFPHKTNKVLIKITPFLPSLPRLTWDPEIENLVWMIKLCMVYNDPAFKGLFQYVIDEHMTPPTTIVSNGQTLSKKACEVLGVISERLNAKDNYALLHALVEPLKSPSFRFKDLLEFSSIDGRLQISSYVAYVEVFDLLNVIIFRTKALLANAESRNTSEQLFDSGEVSFTSLAVEMARVLKELLVLGLRILNEHEFPKYPIHMLTKETIGNFTYEVANCCPLDRLDPIIFESLSNCIVKYHSTRPKLYSRKIFTSLCNVLLKHDPEITNSMLCLLTEKPLFQHKDNVQYSNSLYVDCYHSITVWISAVYLRSSNILDYSLTAESELKLLTTLCKNKSFSDSMFRDSTSLLVLLVCVLRCSSILEFNLAKGYHGNLKSDGPAVINVLVESANLLCGVVKLCSQKCSEDTCSWNPAEDESPSDPSLYEFIEIWSTILEIMPQMIESQTTVLAIGILNSIAEFGESLFNLLRDTPLQRTIITTVLVYCSSTLKSEIRAKAGRALARLIEFNCMSEDISFSMDSFDAIKLNMKAQELNVRIAFSWAFGNWSDIYLQQYLTTNEDNLIDHNQMITDFYNIIRNAHEAKAKVKYNIFRGAGNLLKFVQYMDSENAARIKDVVFILIDQVGKGFDFKARWNASCALRHVFTNDCLLPCLEESVKDRTMQCFIKYMCQSENFKERIQCVVGISSVSSRDTYGEYYMILWEKLATAAAVEPAESQSEVGQAEKLNVEVGRAYVHLTSMLVREDLERLEEIVTAKCERIQSTIKFAVANSPLDDFDWFEKAMANLDKLTKLSLRPFEFEVCRTIYSALYNSSVTDGNALLMRDR